MGVNLSGNGWVLAWRHKGLTHQPFIDSCALLVCLDLNHRHPWKRCFYEVNNLQAETEIDASYEKEGAVRTALAGVYILCAWCINRFGIQLLLIRAVMQLSLESFSPLDRDDIRLHVSYFARVAVLVEVGSLLQSETCQF